MKKNCSWKKTAAFVMAAALVTGVMPAYAGSVFAADEIVSEAENVKAPAVGTFYKVGDTIDVTGSTYFLVDDATDYPALAEITDDLEILSLDTDEVENQYIWYTGEEAICLLHYGFYLTRQDATITPEGFYITGGDGSEGNPFTIGLSAPKVPHFISKNVSLNDSLCLNFIIGDVTDSNKDLYKVKISGDCYENGQVQAIDIKTINNVECYCASANVNANKMGSEITAEIFYGDSETAVSSYSFSVNDYLNGETADETTKLGALVKATKLYGQVSAAYFGNGQFPTDLPNYKDEILNETSSSFGGTTVKKHQPMMLEGEFGAENFRYEPLKSSEASLALVLNSKLAARLYIPELTEGVTAGAEYTGIESTVHFIPSILGDDGDYYFEITDITPIELGASFDINYMGYQHIFTPLSWAYRVMSAESALDKDKAMANALYGYYVAATNYVAE